MKAAGIEEPDYPNAAHHIVAGKAAKAIEARKILEKYGININDAANGVFLPTKKGVSNSVYHTGLHKKTYYKKVDELLSRAKSKEEVLNILDFIRDKLIKGTFMK